MACQTPRPREIENNGSPNKPHDPLLRGRGQLVSPKQHQRPKHIRSQDGNGKPRRSKNKRRNKEDSPDNTAVNAGFKGSRPGQRKKPFKGNRDGTTGLNKILDKLCQIHGTPDKPANHTHRECWVFKWAGKLNAEHKGRIHQAKTRMSLSSKTVGNKRNFHQKSKQ